MMRMKLKKYKIHLIALTVSILIFIIMLTVKLRESLIDPEAWVSVDGFYWNGVKYEESSGSYKRGSLIARDDSGDNIYRVKGDDELNRVVIVSEWKPQLYAKVPTDGNISLVAVTDKRLHFEGSYYNVIDKTKAYEVLEQAENAKESFTYEAESAVEFIYDEAFFTALEQAGKSDKIFTYEVKRYWEYHDWVNIWEYVRTDYNDVPFEIRKEFGFIDNQWVYVDSYAESYHIDELYPQYKIIDKQYWPILEKYLRPQMEREKSKHNIDNEVTIDDVRYTFERKTFNYVNEEEEQRQFSMILPKSFAYMPTDIVKTKFPKLEEDSVIAVVCDDEYRVCFALCFDPITEENTEENIENRIDTFVEEIKEYVPSAVMYAKDVYELQNGLIVGMYDYCDTVEDGEIYTINFALNFSDTELLGWFVCPAGSYKLWEPLAKEMIASVEVMP